jgi:glucan biosynthesis protein C
MTPFRRRRLLLRIGIAAPILALVCTLIAVALFPGFNHATQFLSELGAGGARHPQVFNAGVAFSGIGAGIAGIGFGLAVVALGGSRIAAGLIALAFVLAAIGLVVGSIYVWPDPRHLFINLGLGIQLAPLFLLWGLRRAEGVDRLRWFLVVIFVLMAFLTVMTKHLVLPGTVNPQNVGWWERAFAIVLVGWVGVAAFLLEQRLIALALASAETVPDEGALVTDTSQLRDDRPITN